MRRKTPELSARAPGVLVVGLNDSQSTLSMKSLNTSRVYHKTPRPFGCASRIDPKIVRKSPPPESCHRSREPVNSDLNAGFGAIVWPATTASAVRSASAVAVRDGFADPITGNTAGGDPTPRSARQCLFPPRGAHRD